MWQKKPKNACFREDTEGVPGQPLYKEVTHAVHQTSQQKPGIEMGFILGEIWPVWTKGNREGTKQRKAVGLLDSTHRTAELFGYEYALSFKRREE